jgi:cyanate permease
LLSAASHADDRRFALAIWSGYLPGGVGLVMLLAPLVAGAGGWRALWVASMVVALLAALAVWLLRAAYRRPPPAANPASAPATAAPRAGALGAAKEALARPVPWLLAFAMATWTTQHYVLIIWLPTFLKEQRGLAPLTVSLLACLMVLVNVPGNMLGGGLLQRHFRRGNLIACASVVTGLCGAGIFLDLFPDLVRYGLCLVLSFIGGLIPASVLSSSASLARTPNQIGTLQGLFIQAGNLGPFVGPPAVAMLVASTGNWQYAFVVSGGAAVLGVVLGLVIRRSAAAV